MTSLPAPPKITILAIRQIYTANINPGLERLLINSRSFVCLIITVEEKRVNTAAASRGSTTEQDTCLVPLRASLQERGATNLHYNHQATSLVKYSKNINFPCKINWVPRTSRSLVMNLFIQGHTLNAHLDFAQLVLLYNAIQKKAISNQVGLSQIDLFSHRIRSLLK